MPFRRCHKPIVKIHNFLVFTAGKPDILCVHSGDRHLLISQVPECNQLIIKFWVNLWWTVSSEADCLWPKSLWSSDEETEWCRKQLQHTVITVCWLVCGGSLMKNVSSWKQMDANSCCLTGHRGCSKWKSTPLQLSSDTAKSIGFYHGSQLPEDEEKKKNPLSLPKNFLSYECLNVWVLHFHQTLAAEAVIGAPPGLQKLQLRYFDLHPFKNGQTHRPRLLGV